MKSTLHTDELPTKIDTSAGQLHLHDALAAVAIVSGSDSGAMRLRFSLPGGIVGRNGGYQRPE